MIGERMMMREEAIFVITDLLAYRSPLRVDIFRLADETLECRLVVDPDIAFEAMQRAAHNGGNVHGDGAVEVGGILRPAPSPPPGETQ